VANEAVARGLSVRELEQRVRDLSKAPAPSGSPPKTARAVAGTGQSTSPDPAVRRIEDDLRRYLQTDVKVHVFGDARGKVEVSFYSNDDLERLLELIFRDSARDFGR
jgi:ParB family chromosome partitioning protein